MNRNDAKNLYNELQQAVDTARELHWHFLDTGSEDEAKRAKRRVKKMQDEIDDLLFEYFDKWVGDAKVLIPEIQKMVKDAKDALGDIKKSVDLLKNIPKAMKTFDEIIKIAAGIF